MYFLLVLKFHFVMLSDGLDRSFKIAECECHLTIALIIFNFISFFCFVKVFSK